MGRDAEAASIEVGPCGFGLATGWFTSVRYEQEKVRTITVENEVLRKEKDNLKFHGDLMNREYMNARLDLASERERLNNTIFELCSGQQRPEPSTKPYAER